MKDIRAVEWLPLKEAVKRLSLPREQLFLRNVGPLVQNARRAEAVRAHRGGRRDVARGDRGAQCRG